MSKNYYQYFAYSLAANEIKTIETDANFLYLISNSGATDIEVSIGGQAFQFFPAGISVQLLREVSEKFTQIQIKNSTGGVAAVVLAVSNGIIQNNSSVITGTINVDATANQVQTDAAQTVTTTAGQITALATQKEVIVENISTTITVWIGQVGQVDPATNKGIKILPGEKAILATSAALDMRTDTSTAIVSVTRLLKV